MKDYEKMIMQNDSGYFVAARVPMNNLPGCCVFFWQQVSKTYARRKNAEKAMARAELG